MKFSLSKHAIALMVTWAPFTISTEPFDENIAADEYNKKDGIEYVIGPALRGSKHIGHDKTSNEDALNHTHLSEEALWLQLDKDLAGVGRKCYDDGDCTDPKRPYCLMSKRPGYPLAGMCYGCLNSGDCPKGQECSIDLSDAMCTDHILDEVPGIKRAEFGYNPFLADPLGLLSSNDPGVAKFRFFNHVWINEGRKSLEFCSKLRYVPKNFEVKPVATCSVRGKTKVLTSSRSLERGFSDSLDFTGGGTYKEIDFEGSVGYTVSKKLSQDSMDGKTHTESKAECQLYNFAMIDPSQIKPTQVADTYLRKLVPGRETTVNEDWKSFFDKFGTHLNVEGTIGSWKAMSFTFTESQRSDFSDTNVDLRAGLTIGMENIFQVGGNRNTSAAKKEGKKLMSGKYIHQESGLGDVNKKCEDPGFLKRTLSPICNHVDFNTYNNIVKDDCMKQMKKYCFHVADDKYGRTCNYASHLEFECITTADCDRGSMCVKGTCVPCKLRAQLTEYCVRNDDGGEKGEYEFSINNNHYWSGSLREFECTKNLYGWKPVDVKAPSFYFFARERDCPPWNGNDDGDVTIELEKNYSCERTTYNEPTSFKDEVTFVVEGYVPSSHALEES